MDELRQTFSEECRSHQKQENLIAGIQIGRVHVSPQARLSENEASPYVFFDSLSMLFFEQRREDPRGHGRFRHEYRDQYVNHAGISRSNPGALIEEKLQVD